MGVLLGASPPPAAAEAIPALAEAPSEGGEYARSSSRKRPASSLEMTLCPRCSKRVMICSSIKRGSTLACMVFARSNGTGPKLSASWSSRAPTDSVRTSLGFWGELTGVASRETAGETPPTDSSSPPRRSMPPIRPIVNGSADDGSLVESSACMHRRPRSSAVSMASLCISLTLDGERSCPRTRQSASRSGCEPAASLQLSRIVLPSTITRCTLTERFEKDLRSSSLSERYIASVMLVGLPASATSAAFSASSITYRVACTM